MTVSRAEQMSGWSSADIDENLFAAVEAGIRGVLTKDESSERITEAMRARTADLYRTLVG